MEKYLQSVSTQTIWICTESQVIFNTMKKKYFVIFVDVYVLILSGN